MRGRLYGLRLPRYLAPFLSVFMTGSVINCSQVPRPAVPPSDLVWPKPPDSPRVKFLYAFSAIEDLRSKRAWHLKIGRLLTGSQPARARLVGPYDIFADGNGIFYITDTATRSIHVFDRRAGVHREITTSGEGVLLSPIGVVVHRDGRIFVSDSLLGAVFVYDASGIFLRSIGKGELGRPTGIALGGPGQLLYVVDTMAHAVKVFDLDGTLRASIGGRGSKEGSFNYPTCVALDRDGRIYVGDTLNFRIQVFEPSGRYLSHFGEAGDATGFFSQIKGLDLDSEGHVYVTDAQYDVIQIFSREGNLLLSVGGPGQGPGEFHMPVGLHVDEEDRIHIVDRLNQRIQVLQYVFGKNE